MPVFASECQCSKKIHVDVPDRDGDEVRGDQYYHPRGHRGARYGLAHPHRVEPSEPAAIDPLRESRGLGKRTNWPTASGRRGLGQQPR